MAKTQTQTRKNKMHRKIRGGYNANVPGSINSILKTSPRKLSKSKTYKKKQRKNNK